MREKQMTDDEHSRAVEMLDRIKAGEPLQYVTGVCEFLGLEFRVTPAVLIPRPETEELVVEVCDRFDKNKPLRILDIGTGSGCIPLGIKSVRPNWQVMGIDVSRQALEVALENRRRLNLEVTFQYCDVAHFSWSEPFDVIVSNPPYVADNERSQLQKQVVDHEPDVALFAPPNDVLYFYRLISEKCNELLKPEGSLCFETHYRYAAEVGSVLTKKNFRNVELKRDLSGNDRMIFAQK